MRPRIEREIIPDYRSESSQEYMWITMTKAIAVRRYWGLNSRREREPCPATELRIVRKACSKYRGHHEQPSVPDVVSVVENRPVCDIGRAYVSGIHGGRGLAHGTESASIGSVGQRTKAYGSVDSSDNLIV